MRSPVLSPTLRFASLGAALTLAACAARTGGPHVPDAAPPATPYDRPSTPPPAPSAVRLGPSALRYLVHRRVHIEQDLGGQSQRVETGYRIYLGVRIVAPLDSASYRATYVIDSIVPDSGAVVPPGLNLAAARGLSYSGRISSWGEFTQLAVSDSSAARQLSQVVGKLRHFYPRIPAAGLAAGAAWTDTVTTSDKGPASTITLVAINQSRVATWEPRLGVPCLRIDVGSTFTMTGSGEQNGQPFELSGSGTGAAVAYVSADGRYFGGEERDSTAYTVTLPVQGLTVPVRQVLHSTATVLPER